MDLPLLDDMDMEQQSEFDVENHSQVAMEDPPPPGILLRPRHDLFGTAVEPATLAQAGWKLNPTPIVWLSVSATVPYPEHRVSAVAEMFSLDQGSETRYGVTCGFQVNHPRLYNEKIYFSFSDMMIYREGRYQVAISIILTHQNSIYRIQAMRFDIEVILDEALVEGPSRHERHISHVLRGCPQWYTLTMNGRYADQWARLEEGYDIDDQEW